MRKSLGDHLNSLQNIGAKVTISWSSLPKPPPEKGAVFGDGTRFFIAEPKEDGLEFTRVSHIDAMAYKKKCETKIEIKQ